MKILRTIPLLFIILSLPACTTSDLKEIKRLVGLDQKPFNPDEITISLIEIKTDLQSSIDRLKKIQMANRLIRSQQIKLEGIDKQLKARPNPIVAKNLLATFYTTLKQRITLREKNFEDLMKLESVVKKQERNRLRIMSQIDDARSDFGKNSPTKTKLNDQRQTLVKLASVVDNIEKSLISSEDQFQSLADYTLNYDDNHPKISRLNQ